MPGPGIEPRSPLRIIYNQWSSLPRDNSFLNAHIKWRCKLILNSYFINCNFTEICGSKQNCLPSTASSIKRAWTSLQPIYGWNQPQRTSRNSNLYINKRLIRTKITSNAVLIHTTVAIGDNTGHKTQMRLASEARICDGTTQPNWPRSSGQGQGQPSSWTSATRCSWNDTTRFIRKSIEMSIKLMSIR